MPLAPALQQQGISVDFEAVARIWAKYTDMTELNDILVMSGVEDLAQQNGGGGAPDMERNRPRQSPVTHRVNERVNRPGATTHGKADVLSRLLMQGGAQDSEIGALMRPTG